MHAKLVIVAGKANKSQVSVKLPMVIGRSREADLTIAHPMISRKHCELYEVNGLVMIRDLGSLNGLFVGGTQVGEAALHPNAEFTVGPLTFRIEYEQASQAAALPDESTVDEPDGPLEAAAGEEHGLEGEGPDFEVADPSQPPPSPDGAAAGSQPPIGEEGPTLREDQPGSTASQPAIAPPDGQLPDFSAWGEGQVGRAGPEQAVEPRQGEAPEPAPPRPPFPPAPIPETTAFEQEELAEAEKSDQPPVDAAQHDQAPEPVRTQPSVAQQPPRPAEEGTAEQGTEESAADDGPGVETEGDGLFDLSLPPGPDVHEPEDLELGDDDLNRFLKGLE